MALTNKQRIFVEEYLRCWNATAAARVAGYAFPNVEGPKNLVKPCIADEIRQRIDEHAMSADEALALTAKIARGDLTEFITPDQEIDIEKMRADGKGHLLKKFKRTRRVITTKHGDEIETITIEAELYPADAAQDRILRHHGSYIERHEISGKDGAPLIQRVEVIAPTDDTASE